MDKSKSTIDIRSFILFVVIVTFTGFVLSVQAAEIDFTQEETDYLAQGIVLKAVSIEGVAPHHYRDSKGEIKGIAMNVLEEIASMTGIVLEYYLYESIDDAINSEFDIFFGSTKEYAPPGIVLSKPYLKSETVLFYNKSMDLTQLDGKRYAGIAGGTLPEGVREDYTIYFNDREETINAVEAGRADYGFGNAYSVAFYTLQNSYKNIITVPIAKEERAYSVGVPEGNGILLSIMNKAIEAIDKSRMDTLVLEVASQVERKVTVPMVIESYWKEIFGLLVVVLAMLGYIVFLTVRSKKRIAIENERYKIVTQISDDYLFEYQVKEEKLHVPKKLNEKIDVSRNEEQLIEMFKKLVEEFDDNAFEKNISIIKMSLRSGGMGTFRMVFSYIKDTNEKIYSIIGKFVDITEEAREKEQLIIKAELDGLTGLYNLTTAKEAIINSMKKKTDDTLDALIIIDCDEFKDINDKYGHLEGNEALKNIAKALKDTFRKTDIIGRLGGDEFWVYMHDISSVEFVQNKCQQLISNIQESNVAFKIGISVGIAIFAEKLSYEQLFQRADQALYSAKGNPSSQIIVYKEYDKESLH